MQLSRLSEAEFQRALSDFARPSSAVTSPQHLHGRGEALRRTRKALNGLGSQVFIFGERGVGKTSLAKTALLEFCPTFASRLLVSCERSSTFSIIIGEVAKRMVVIAKAQPKQKQLKSSFMKYGFSVELTQSWSDGLVHEINDINSAISLLRAVQEIADTPLAVIIDEFDLISCTEEKYKFANFVKQLSDQDVKIKFMFCGIAGDVESLIGAHFSSGRYLEPIELGPLKPGDLFLIYEKACDAFDVELDGEAKIRAALIADGYPYFMHLFAENSIAILHEGRDDHPRVTPHVFAQAIKRSIERAEPMLKSVYDAATKKYTDDYQQVLWAVAAPKLFENKWDEIYAKSYKGVIAPVLKGNILTKDMFYKRLLSLTKVVYGSILKTNTNGWYSYSENVVRSYARMRAADRGVDLGIDVHRAQ